MKVTPERVGNYLKMLQIMKPDYMLKMYLNFSDKEFKAVQYVTKENLMSTIDRFLKVYPLITIEKCQE